MGGAMRTRGSAEPSDRNLSSFGLVHISWANGSAWAPVAGELRAPGRVETCDAHGGNIERDEQAHGGCADGEGAPAWRAPVPALLPRVSLSLSDHPHQLRRIYTQHLQHLSSSSSVNGARNGERQLGIVERWR